MIALIGYIALVALVCVGIAVATAYLMGLAARRLDDHDGATLDHIDLFADNFIPTAKHVANTEAQLPSIDRDKFTGETE